MTPSQLSLLTLLRDRPEGMLRPSEIEDARALERTGHLRFDNEGAKLTAKADLLLEPHPRVILRQAQAAFEGEMARVGKKIASGNGSASVYVEHAKALQAAVRGLFLTVAGIILKLDAAEESSPRGLLMLARHVGRLATRLEELEAKHANEEAKQPDPDPFSIEEDASEHSPATLAAIAKMGEQARAEGDAEAADYAEAVVALAERLDAACLRCGGDVHRFPDPLGWRHVNSEDRRDAGTQEQDEDHAPEPDFAEPF
jgi:hypothetical protein